MSIKKSHNATFIFERLKEVSNSKNLEDLADFLGINYGTIRNQKARGTIPYDEIVSKCDENELIYVLKGYRKENSKDSEFVDLPFYASVTASAGQGIVAEQEKKPLTIKFRSYYIKNTLQSRASALFGMKIRGDSMYPVLTSGDLVLVDQEKRQSDDHNIFAVRIDQDVYCKYVLRLPGNRFKLASANSLYPPIEVAADDYNFGVLGRLVHLSRTL